MKAVWSRAERIAVIHPGWPKLSGRRQVMDSWRNILTGGGAPPNIRSVNAQAYVYPGSAFVICYEAGADRCSVRSSLSRVLDCQMSPMKRGNH